MFSSGRQYYKGSENMNLTKKIEDYAFECEAGPLIKCVDWDALKRTIDLWVVVKRWAESESIPMHTSGKGGWRFTVHTNQAEAQATADVINRNHFNGQPICGVRHLLTPNSFYTSKSSDNIPPKK
jgi:hypothetical protein